jgi:hypothetical protein
MKIVKFKDGRYGVRKWEFQSLGYVFYYVRDGDTTFNKGRTGFWGVIDETWESGMKQEAYNSALELYKAIVDANNYEKSLKDTGTPIKEQL